MSSGVKSRDKLIVDDFWENWEQLLGLTGHLRDKERKSIRKTMEVIGLKPDTKLIAANSEFLGIFNITLIRSHVNNTMYLLFAFSSSKAVVYEVNPKKKEVRGFGARILDASEEGVLLDTFLPTGPNWRSYFYMLPLQCKDCSIKGDVDRSACPEWFSM